MKKSIVYGSFAFAELVLYLLKTLIEGIANRYFAVSQMEIDTGFLYENVIVAVDMIWLVCALAVLTAAIVYYVISNKEKEE